MERSINLVGVLLAIASALILTANGEVCWYNKIYNTHHPTLKQSTDMEPNPTGAELAKVCPTGKASTIAIRCYDDNGNEFLGTRNDTCRGAPGQYLLTCDAKHGGMLCAPHDGGSNCTCPDFKAQFGCECAPGVTNAPSGRGPGGKGAQSGSNQLQPLIGWIAALVLAAFSF